MTDRHPRGPAECKAAATALGFRSGSDILALSRNRDPYFAGTDAHLRDAEWFADHWQAAGYSAAHLRRFHYRLFSLQETLPDGQPYLNNTHCWNKLGEGGTYARYLLPERVPVDAVTDARNAPAIRNVRPEDSGREPWAEARADRRDPDATMPNWRLPGISALPLIYSGSGLELPSFEVGGYDYDTASEPVLLSSWCEKSTMDDVLVPLCRQLAVNYVSGTGYESITAAVAMLRRAEAYPSKRLHVLYISDYDPAGQNMPRSIARQAQFWAEQLGITARVTLEPLILTAQQVRDYGLPEDFTHPGEGRVELDALEAFRPGELAELVRHAVQPWRDPQIRVRLADAEAGAVASVSDEWSQAGADIAEELDRLRDEAEAVLEPYRERVQELERELREIREEVEPELAPLRERLQDLAGEVMDLAEGLDPELPERPEATEPDIDTDPMLYDSARDWITQLAAYRRSREQE